MKVFTLKSEFDLPLTCLFQWHLRNGAFERLNPPWHPLYIIFKKGSIDNEGIVIVKMPIIKNLGFKWKINHKDYIQNKSFKDVQVKGIFSYWEHQHIFSTSSLNSLSSSSDGINKSTLEDNIKYSLPFGPIGNILSPIVDNNLSSMFKYRHRITKIDNNAHLKFKNQNINSILISGSSGFIGSSLIPFLSTGGYNITRLLRNKLNLNYDIAKRIYLNKDGYIDNSIIDYNNKNNSSNTISDSIDTNNNFDAIINLNGESIFGLWTKNKKQKIFSSRVKFTQSLCKDLAKMNKPPKVLISASAIGIYGNDHYRTFDDIDENNRNKNNKDFLSDLCSQWEEATDIAKSAGIRVINLRTGIVLGASGGLVNLLRNINKFQINIKMESDTWLSWIALDDLLRLILFCICNNNMRGPVNAVSPNYVKLDDFEKTLAKIWNTKINFKFPKKIVQKILGEMSKYTIFADNKVTPRKLILNNFDFIFEDLESALRHTLGKLNNLQVQ